MAKLLSGTRIYGTATVDTQLFVSGSNVALSTITGALQVVGGIGVGGAGHFGGNVTSPTFIGALTGVATTATNLASGAAGSLPYQSSTGTTAMLSLGLNGYVLTAGATAPQWTAISSLSAGLATTATNVENGLAGQLVYQSSPGITGFVTTAATGFILSSNGSSAPSYVSQASLSVGTATSSTRWTTARTVTFTGDTTGTFTIDGSADVSGVNLTIQPNSVELGTDTTGNYVATGATSGFGLSGSTTGENQTFTVTSNATSSNTTSTLVFRDASGNFAAGTITANLTGVATLATTATNVAGGSTGSVVYQSATGTTAMLALGTTGFVLVAGTTAPQWTAISGLSAGLATTATNIAGGTAGQVPYQSSPGITSFYGPGTAGNVLVSNGTTAPSYQNTLTLTGTTSSTSTTTGALQVIGGVGIGGNLYVGGEIVAQKLTIQFTTVTTTLIQTDDVISTYNTTSSTSTNTGALQIAGGAGFGGRIYAGGLINGAAGANITGSVTATTFFGALTGTATNATNVIGGAAGSVVYQSAANTTAMLELGTAGFVLTAGASAPQWTAVSGLSAGLATTATNVVITNDTSTITPQYITFVSTTTSAGGTGLKAGSANSLNYIPSSGFHGIGIDVPTAPLHIVSSVNSILRFRGGTTGTIGILYSDANIASLTNNSTSESYAILSGTNALSMSTNATTRLTIDSNGQVKVITSTASTSTSTGALVVNGGVGIGDRLYVGGLINGAAGANITGSVTATTFVGALTGTASRATNVVGGSTGSLHYQSAVDVTAMLALGTNGQVLTAGATAPQWTSIGSLTAGLATTATNVAGGSTGSVVYQSATGTTAMLAISTAGYFLSVNAGATAPQWTQTLGVTNGGTGVTTLTGVAFGNGTSAFTAATGAQISTALGSTNISGNAANVTGIVATNNGGTGLSSWTAGDIAYYSSGTALTKLALGTSGFILTAGATAPQWTAIGSLTAGIATTATQVQTTAQANNANYFPTFVDSNNASATGELVYTTSSFSINPSTNVISLNGVALANTVNSQSTVARFNVVTGNTDSLEISNVRGTAGADWTTAGFRIQQKVDSTWMGYIQFNGNPSGANNGGMSFGAGTTTVSANAVTERLRITSSGDVIVLNTTAVSSTSTGALQVRGGVGVSGNVFVGGTVTATNFVGTFTGAVTGAASQVQTTRQATNATYFPTFVDANNASAAAETVFTTSTFSINPSTGIVSISGNVFLTGGSSQLNTGFTNRLNVSGAIVAGSASSTNGSIILQGQYGTGSITNFGTEYSSGGPVISYGVYPSNLGTGAFFSSSGAALTRAAYTQAGNIHNWYVGGAQTVAIGSTATLALAMSVSSTGLNLPTAASGNANISFDGTTFTLVSNSSSAGLVLSTNSTERLRITSTGGIAFGGASNFGSSGQILQSNGNAAPTWVAQSTIAAGSAPLTSTYVGFGSGSNLLTGSSSLTWNGATFYVNGRLLNAGGLKTYSVQTTGQGAVNAVYEIMKVSRDSVNWSTNTSYEITVRSSYYAAGGYSKWLLSYGYGDTGTLVCTYAGGGGGMLRVYIGSEVSVNANCQYKPVFVDLPPYMMCTVEVRYNTTEVASVGAINSSGQVFFSNIMTASGGTGAFYNGNTHLVPSGGNVGIGTTTPLAPLSVHSVNRSFDGYGNINVFTTNASTTDMGGSIAFGGENAQGTTPYVFGKIQGGKESGGTWNGYLTLGTTRTSSAVTEAVRINSLGNVGIGTPTPLTRLHISTKVADDNSYVYDTNSIYVVHQTPTSTTVLNDPKEVLLLARQGTGGQAYGAAASFKLSRYENSSVSSRTRLDLVLAHDSFLNTPVTVMTARSSGNVGIGTTTPQYRLDVNNANASIFQASFGATIGINNVSGIHFGYSEAANQSYRKSAIVFERTDAAGGGGNAAGKVHILNGPAVGSGSATLTDARLTIGELGSVGIGFTAPDQPLAFADTVAVKIQLNGNNANGYQLGLATAVASGDAMMKFTAGETGAGEFGFYNTTNLRLLINNTGALILNGIPSGAGNFLVLRGGTGTSSEGAHIVMGYGNNTSSALTNQGNNSWNVDVAGGVANNDFRIFRQNNAGATAVAMNILESNAGVQLLSLGVGTAGSGTTGEIRATNEITAYYSDRRLKENVKPIDNAIEKVLSLNGITYTPNDLARSFGYTSDKTIVGLFADEVDAVLPEAVRPAPFDQDENGKSKSGENYQTIQYEKIVPLLVEAIKEQQKQIAQLSEMVSKLVNK